MSLLYFTRHFVVFYARFLHLQTTFKMVTATGKNHMGHKIVRIRELRGMKQKTLADILGVKQQTISKIEQSEEVEEDRLGAIASALGVTPELIKSFNEEALFTNIQHNSETASHNLIVNYQFNPMEKVVELYERLLKGQQEEIDRLQAELNKNR